MHKCTSATVTMHICMVTVSSCIWYIYFSLSPPHSLFFSLVWLSPQAHFSSTDLRCSLRSRHNCATTDHLTRCYSHWLLLLTPIAATLPITVAIFFLSLMALGFWSVGFNGQLFHCSFKSFHSRATADHLTCRYSRQLSLPRQSLLLSPIAIAIFFSLFDGFGILISGFWLVVLGFWWVGWWWWLCRLMMKVGLMIAATLFFLCLIIDGGWVLSQEWIFYWINVYNRQTDVGIL